MRARFALVFALLCAAEAADAQPPRGDLRPERRALERRFRDRMREILRARLDLTDEQAMRLADANERFEPRRARIIAAEIETRRGLRRELAPGGSANQGRVDSLLKRALQTERERLDLIDDEQRELSAFLTPVQRARYFGLQEQLRAQIEGIREARGVDSGRRGPGGLRRRPPAF
jgi:hypothetical protein